MSNEIMSANEYEKAYFNGRLIQNYDEDVEIFIDGEWYKIKEIVEIIRAHKKEEEK